MCTYCTTSNYRKIYENHTGVIPKDSDGRTYEIHHIDGNHSNNDPSNLKAVTLQEHYDIHYDQGDWYACKLMKLQRMDYTPEELSELSRKTARTQIENGTHNFLGDKNPVHALVKNGTHNFLDKEAATIRALKRIAAGTHNWLSGEEQRKNNQKRIENGTHPFIGDKNPVYKQLENGTHPSQIKVCCIHCKKEIGMPTLKQWHGAKCKQQI